MAMFTLNKALKTFEEVTETPTDFLDINKQVLNGIKLNIKEIYDFSKQEETQSRKKNVLQKLFVENLDSEQIWQQVEIQNESVLNSFLNKISVLLVDKDNLKFKDLEVESEKQDSDSDVDSVDNDSQHSDDNSNIEIKTNDLNGSEESSSDNEDEANEKKQANSVDDKFFKLSEMENFLKSEEKKLENPVVGDDSDSEGSEAEGSIDFFKDDEVLIDEEEEEQSKLARFKDYFVAKDEQITKPRKNKLLAELEENSDVETDEEKEEEPREEIKSSLKRRQEHLKKKIDKLEEQAVSEKPWQLKGEISADKRPQNSLLEEVVGFDLTSRPAPVITEQTSLQLEDIIRQRIKDKVFDSVARKTKPIDTPLEYRKKIVLDQEKSKKSLTQIYEQEYVKQQAELDPANAEREEEEPKLHSEVRTMMTSVFTKLDALSNFHFTSKPTVPELKIISHLPAVNMEEVAPVVASDATLLAPEEIKKKTKNIIGRGERTISDKKRERRQKKIKQKVHSQLKLKKENAMKETGKLKKGLQKTT